MLNSDFNNGKKLNLPASLAVFTIIMGFLFLLDASSGVNTLVAGSLIVFGFAWYFGNHALHWWQRHQHPHR